MFAPEVKLNPACDAFKIEKGNGDVRDYNIRTAAAVVLYDTSTRGTYSSLEPLEKKCSMHTWYLVRYMQAPNRLSTDYTNQRYGGLSRA